MCTDCGCGDTDLVPVEVQHKILAGNDKLAQHNREHFVEAGVLAINLMGSPGAGKTAILEATARHQQGWKLSALAGDLATDRDAARLEKAGIPSKAITTGSACANQADTCTATHSANSGEYARIYPTLADQSSQTSATTSWPTAPLG